MPKSRFWTRDMAERINVIRPGGPRCRPARDSKPGGFSKVQKPKAHSNSNISIWEVVKKVGNGPEAESIEYVDRMTSSAGGPMIGSRVKWIPVTSVASGIAPRF